MSDNSQARIEQLDEPIETAGGRLKLGYHGEDRAPVYLDPETGLISFGCGMVPVCADEDDEE